MKKTLRIFSLLYILVGTCLGISANNDMQKMTDANKAYQQENYSKATELYKQIADSNNVGAVLFYNLGNAYYKNGDISHSRLWYERALQLDPGNDDIKHNIAFVNQKITDRIGPVPESAISEWWNHFSQQLTERQWSIISLIAAFLLAVTVILFMIIRSNTVHVISLITLILSLITLIFSIIFASKEKYRYIKQPEAIVMELVVTAKSEPTANGKNLFVIHEGLKVKITGTMENWAEIQIPNGEKGWVPINEIEKI